MSATATTVIEITVKDAGRAYLKNVTKDGGTLVVLGNELPFTLGWDGSLTLHGGLWDADLDGYVISLYTDGTDTEIVVVPAELWETLADWAYARVMAW
jgi:hypothetical protein